jgi:hypothetical protein
MNIKSISWYSHMTIVAQKCDCHWFVVMIRGDIFRLFKFNVLIFYKSSRTLSMIEKEHQ